MERCGPTQEIRKRQKESNSVTDHKHSVREKEEPHLAQVVRLEKSAEDCRRCTRQDGEQLWVRGHTFNFGPEECLEGHSRAVV